MSRDTHTLHELENNRARVYDKKLELEYHRKKYKHERNKIMEPCIKSVNGIKPFKPSGTIR